MRRAGAIRASRAAAWLTGGGGFGGGAGPSAALEFQLVRERRRDRRSISVAPASCPAARVFECTMSIESPRELIGKRGPRSLSPSLVAQRVMRLLHRTGDILLAKTRKIGGRAGRCRDPYDKSKKLASRRLYWSAIPIAAEAHQNSLRRADVCAGCRSVPEEDSCNPMQVCNSEDYCSTMKPVEHLKESNSQTDRDLRGCSRLLLSTTARALPS